MFRVDSSTLIGSGHLLRCLTLARAFRKEGAIVLFVCRNLNGNSIKQITDNGFKVEILSCDEVGIVSFKNQTDYPSWLGVTLEKDAEQSKAILSNYKPDLLVVDHYGLDSSWETKVMHLCKKLLVIDDLANRHHVCDFLVDQNLGRLVSHYQNLVPRKCQILVGPKYAMLRDEFIQHRNYSIRRRKNPKLKSILISMGGVDRLNTTRNVLFGLSDSKLTSKTSINIIMGDSAPHTNDIINISKSSRFKIEVLRNVNNMAKLLSTCDLAIGAGGSSTWERSCLGVPSIVVVTADNQMMVALEVEKSGSGKAILSIDSLSKKIKNTIDELIIPTDLEHMTEHALKVTNGRGVNLVAGAVF